MAPELVEEEEHAGRQRQGAEKRGHAHAQRELASLHIAVDVEAAGEGREQCVMVRAHGLCLCRIERQHALRFKPGQLGLENRDLVGALLRLAT